MDLVLCARAREEPVKRERWIIIVTASAGCAFAAACSGDNGTSDGGTDASNDTTEQQDSNKPDTGANDAAKDVQSDAPVDSGCPTSWFDLPDASMLEPDGGLPPLIIHATAAGTQDYTCEEAQDGGFGWIFVGPEANLEDCTQALIAYHFASEAGAGAPEWQATADNSYVIASKLLTYTPDGGQGSVPWLLLQKTSTGGTGTISKTLYVQRLHTDGGITPTTTCDGNDLDATTKVPYTADYYFYGN